MARRHSIERGAFNYHFRAFPADVCLDRFADIQASVLSTLFVDFGQGNGGAELTAGQKLEATITALTSLSGALNAKTIRFMRDMVLDPKYTSVAKDGNQAVQLTSDNIERLDIPASDLLFILVEGFKFQFGDLFTSALSHFGLDLSQIKAGSLLERFKTGLNATDVSGASGSPEN